MFAITHRAGYAALRMLGGAVGASRPLSARPILQRVLACTPLVSCQPLRSVTYMAMASASVGGKCAALRMAAPQFGARSAASAVAAPTGGASPQPRRCSFRSPSPMCVCFSSAVDLPKEFCIAGPARHDKNYALDLSHLSRGGDDLSALFHLERCVKATRNETYFTVHGARQSMKSSFLRLLQSHINGDESLKQDYECVYVSLERIQQSSNDELSVSHKICDKLATAAAKVGDGRPLGMLLALQSRHVPLSALLSDWSYLLWTEEKKSLVILFDEFDNLRGEPLLFVLGELRSGYMDRGDHRYPTSVVLCGMRRLQDYKTEDGKSIIGTSSPFNVALGPLHTVPLTRDQVAELYTQHTTATGQRFEVEAVDRAFYWTQGQPWLVNRIGYEVTTRMAESSRLPPTEPVTAAHIDAAADVIIDERSTHVDSLMSFLSEDRVRLVVESVLQDRVPHRLDTTFCRELGLLKPEGYEIANPLYAQVLTRALLELFEERVSLAERFAAHRLVDPETGGFHLTAFVQSFCNFARQFLPRTRLNHDSTSAPAHMNESNIEFLLLSAAFHSINGSGRIDQQQRFGERRADITIELPRMRLDGSCKRYEMSDTDNVERIVLELKMGARREKGVKDAAKQFTDDMLAQVVDYTQRWGRVDRMAVIVFDTNKVAMKGTDPGTSVYHTTMPLPTDKNRIVSNVIRCICRYHDHEFSQDGQSHELLR